jgi:hypothetical protein
LQCCYDENCVEVGSGYQLYGRSLLFNVSTYAHSQDNLLDGLLHSGTLNDVTFDGVSRMSGRRLWRGICAFGAAVDRVQWLCAVLRSDVMPCVLE